jgi:hypothetical protein
MLIGTAMNDHTVTAANPQTTHGSWSGPKGLKISVIRGTKNHASDIIIGIQIVATIRTPTSLAPDMNQAHTIVKTTIGAIPLSTDSNIIFQPANAIFSGRAENAENGH